MFAISLCVVPSRLWLCGICGHVVVVLFCFVLQVFAISLCVVPPYCVRAASAAGEGKQRCCWISGAALFCGERERERERDRDAHTHIVMLLLVHSNHPV